MSTTTTATTLQELLQCEQDTFIPDELDDKLYDDKTYNWEVLFETVKLFLVKEGRWPRGKREEDKRDVVMADGSVQKRDWEIGFFCAGACVITGTSFKGGTRSCLKRHVEN